mmetsp:Transcript_29400/g.83698  ORF Transcript_29400/g.83698 Transcript_29400/m.83698 type:complete len:241 (-) Transcript_29400:165-887(-)
MVAVAHHRRRLPYGRTCKRRPTCTTRPSQRTRKAPALACSAPTSPTSSAVVAPNGLLRQQGAPKLRSLQSPQSGAHGCACTDPPICTSPPSERTRRPRPAPSAGAQHLDSAAPAPGTSSPSGALVVEKTPGPSARTCTGPPTCTNQPWRRTGRPPRSAARNRPAAAPPFPWTAPAAAAGRGRPPPWLPAEAPGPRPRGGACTCRPTCTSPTARRIGRPPAPSARRRGRSGTGRRTCTNQT